MNLIRLYLIIGFVFIISFLAHSQTVLTGEVVDEEGLPIENSTVSTEDERVVAFSGEDGRFIIKVSDQDTVLKITSIGYTTKYVQIIDEADILIQLVAETRELEEVDIYYTGYQKIPKERSTGSFELITQNDFKKRVSNNILDQLEGFAPGLQYDNRSGKPIINIRGINTMSDNLMGPLIVVDNFPYEGNIADINPDDVESVTLLKDAAAASIWGARAGNGVIVISLKRPELSEQAIKAEVNSRVTVNQKPRLFDIPSISSKDFIEIEQFLFDQRHYDAVYNNEWSSRTAVFSPVVDYLYSFENDEISYQSLQDKLSELGQKDIRNDLLSYFYRNKVLEQYSASITGGSIKNAWMLSIGLDKDMSEVIGQKGKLLTTNLSNTLNISDKIKLNLSLRVTRDQSEDNSARFTNNYTPGGGRTTLYPYASVVGDGNESLSIPRSYNVKYIEGLADAPLLDWMYRPLDEFGATLYNDKKTHVLSTVDFKYTPFKGIGVSFIYTNEIQNSETYTIYNQNSFYTRDLINRYSQVDGEVVNYIIPNSAIRDSGNQIMGSHKIRGVFDLNRSFNDGLYKVYGIIGAEIASTNREGNSSRYYGYNAKLLNVESIDYKTNYPIYDGLAGNSTIPFSGGFSKYVDRFVSYYTNLAHTYDDKYTISFSARKDAANIFGVKANDRWKPLWSTGLAWTITNEEFFKDIPWVTYLKLRTTFGHSGNSGGVSSTYPRISHSDPLSLDLAGKPYAMVTGLPNPNLKWEDVRMLNLGLDFNVFNNKLSGSLEFFDKKSTDLIAPDEIDPTSGMSSIVTNVGTIDGRGFDISLSTNVMFGNVKWTGNVFLSHSVSKVKEYRGKEGLANIYLFNSGTMLNPLLGRQLYPIFALNFYGLDSENGDPIGLLDGEESKDYASMLRDSLNNIIYYGTALPPFHGSFGHNFSWKGLDVYFLLTFKFGHYFQKNTIMYNSLFNSWNGHSDISKRWMKPGDEKVTTIPSLSYPISSDRDEFYAFSEPNVEKGGVVRLQDIRISYSLSLFNRKKAVNTSVFSSLSNAGILWRANSSGLDPDFRGIPMSKRFSIGLSCSF